MDNENEIYDNMQDNDNIVDISRYSFSSFGIERSIRDLIAWEERKKVIIPDFQRKFVWDFNKCCKFVESILLNLPIPNMFMFRDRSDDSEKYVLIDGLQRFTCIKQFINGIYDDGKKKRDFKINIKNSKWKNMTFNLLEEEDKDAFNDYSIKINIFDSNDKDDSTKKLYMTEVFERINSGSEKLTDQEIRNAVYSSEATSVLKEASNNSKLKDLLSYSNKYSDNRCNDEEFILRVITYYNIYKKFIENNDCLLENFKITSSKKYMLSQYLYFASIGKIDIKDNIEKFNSAIDIIYEFSKNPFNSVDKENQKMAKSVHELTAEALIITVMLGNSINISSQQFDENKIKYWLETADNDNPFYSSTTSRESILKRIKIMKSLLGINNE